MSQTPTGPRTAFDIALEATRKWRAESNLAAENRSLTGVIAAALRIAVTNHDEPTSGIAALNDLDCREHLERILECNSRIWDALRSNGRPSAAVSHNITAAHVATLVGEHDLARDLIQPALDATVINHFPLTPFWRGYATALDGFFTQSTFTFPNIKLKGYEKHWMPYISLMVAITSESDPTDAIAAIDDSFDTRNKDKRLTDWEMIDGDGNVPVRWDFRKATLLGTS